MKALEIIHLRMADAGAHALGDTIRSFVESQSDVVDVRLYRHARIETDLVIHLHRVISDPTDRACASGDHLAARLREYGMVEHSVWVEVRGRADG